MFTNAGRWQLVFSTAFVDQLFQFDGQLYEQFDGVAMVSPQGPLLANVFLCSIEDTLELEGRLPPYYRRYVDNTLTIMPSTTAANDFLLVLNSCHHSVKFTMELEQNKMLPFVGINLINKSTQIDTSVHIKPTNTGLLIHYQSHVDDRYKHCLLRTMLDRAYRLSSSWEYFSDECTRLQSVFNKLFYPENLISRTINRFISEKTSTSTEIMNDNNNSTQNITRVTIPFKDQKSANEVKSRLKDIGNKVDISIQPVFTSRKLNDVLRSKELKPSVVNQQRVVYEFKCGLCDAGYIGYTMRHLHERCAEHKLPSSSIGKHYKNEHGRIPMNINDNFVILRKCNNKYDCLVYEMLFIRDKTPSLNVQSDSIKAKLFT